MNIIPGDLVRFKHGLYPDEIGMVYMVLEVNGDWVMLESYNTNMTIKPTSVAMLNELEKI